MTNHKEEMWLGIIGIVVTVGVFLATRNSGNNSAAQPATSPGISDLDMAPAGVSSYPVSNTTPPGMNFNVGGSPNYLTYNFPASTSDYLAPLLNPTPAATSKNTGHGHSGTTSGSGGACCDGCASDPSSAISAATQSASMSATVIQNQLSNLNSVGNRPKNTISPVKGTAQTGSGTAARNNVRLAVS